jgi:hypothetical protein
MQVFLPFDGSVQSMEFNKDEMEQFSQLLNHIFSVFLLRA